MPQSFYSAHNIETIARRILTAYDSALYYGDPAAIPIEDMIEAHGLSLEYQYLRKNGRILGKTVFDDGLEIVYDMDRQEYILYPVRAGTILIDASLCGENASTGRLRFTACAPGTAPRPSSQRWPQSLRSPDRPYVSGWRSITS